MRNSRRERLGQLNPKELLKNQKTEWAADRREALGRDPVLSGEHASPSSFLLKGSGSPEFREMIRRREN